MWVPPCPSVSHRLSGTGATAALPRVTLVRKALVQAAPGELDPDRAPPQQLPRGRQQPQTILVGSKKASRTPPVPARAHTPVDAAT